MSGHDRRPAFSFDSVVIGDAMGPITLTITADLNQSQIVEPRDGAMGDPLAASRSTVVEPTIFMRNFVRLMRTTWRTTHSMVQAGGGIRIHREVAVGQDVTVTGRIAEKYVRKGRPYIVIQSETMVGGELISEEWSTLIVTYEG